MILLVRCLCQRKNLLLLAEGFSLGFFQLLSGMRRLFLKTVPFDDSGSIPMERAVSQERICQQAERLLPVTETAYCSWPIPTFTT